MVNWIVSVTPQNVILTQNVITIAAKCNTNAKCNNIDAKCNKAFNAKCKNFSTQNVIQVGTRSQSTKSEVYSINGMCAQTDYWWGYRVTKFAIKGTGESHKLFGDKILKIPQPTNKRYSFSYFLSEAIMYRHEIDISEDLSQGGRRGLI